MLPLELRDVPVVADYEAEPVLLNVVDDSPIRRTKKYANRIRISAASAVKPHCKTGLEAGAAATARGSSGRRERWWRLPPPLLDPATRCTSWSLAAPCPSWRASRRKRRIRELVATRPQRLLAVAEGVGQELLQSAGHACAGAAVLTRILVGLDERLGDDRIGRGTRGVDRRDPQIRRDLDPDRGRRGVGDGRRDELAGRVLDRGIREAVLECVGLLDVTDRALGLLDRGGDARVAFGPPCPSAISLPCPCRPGLPLRADGGEELREARRGS